MKCSIKIPGLIAVLFFLFIITTMADAKDTRYVVVFQNEQVPENAARLIEAAGGRLVKTFPDIGVGIAVSSSPDFADSLSNTPGIYSVSVERSLKVQGARTSGPVECASDSKNDACYGAQWNIRRVHADEAWSVTTGSHQTVVAVIDTGIATNHPDLKKNVVYNECFSTSGICNPYPEDPNLGYHGTAVASVIAASFRGGGLIGVGPDLGLANYNVWDAAEQNAFDSSVWAAMLDAAKRGFKVINISLYGLYRLPDDYKTINAWTRVVSKVMKKGSLIIACAGNEGINLNDPEFCIPADLPGVISVGATGIRPKPFYPQRGAYDVRAHYSNYGKTIDLVAPGGDLGPNCDYNKCLHYGICKNCYDDYSILAADVLPNPGCAEEETLCPVGYYLNFGTSFSAPHVSAVAGLMLDVNPNLSPSEITAILKGTADYLGDPLQFGSGMVNALSAIEKARMR